MGGHSSGIVERVHEVAPAVEGRLSAVEGHYPMVEGHLPAVVGHFLASLPFCGARAHAKLTVLGCQANDQLVSTTDHRDPS